MGPRSRRWRRGRALPVVTGLAGYLVHRGSLPDPPGLPTLRAFQRAQAGPALAWLERLLSS